MPGMTPEDIKKLRKQLKNTNLDKPVKKVKKFTVKGIKQMNMDKKPKK